VVSLLAGGVVPGEALAHGLAHSHEHEEASHAGHRSDVAADDTALAVEAQDHGHEHGHARLEAASVRVDVPMLGLSAVRWVPVVPVVSAPQSLPIRRDVMARGDPSRGPPPRLRAPPLR
jgi:hypothetical protein